MCQSIDRRLAHLPSMSSPPPERRSASAALVAASSARWTLMFWLLGVALLVDGIDGDLRAQARVREVLPRWSGDVLDLVVDFVTYVFVPAYASPPAVCLPSACSPAGIVIVVTGALYFADRDMKTADNYFRGLPGAVERGRVLSVCSQAGAWIAAAAIVVSGGIDLRAFKFLHPFRVTACAP
jgi:phosphatidylcholine synthase